MDSNGTRFHLIHLKHDWESWWSVRHGVTLGELFDPANAFPAAEIEWNRGEENLRLARQALQFQGAATQPDTNLANRRGAGRDRYGHWYWIDEARTGIYFLAQGEHNPVMFWSSTTADPCDTAGADKSRFRSREPAAPVPVILSGLAVTAGHYLVVGVVGQGLLIFDLHRGGPPVLLLWTLPAGETFAPWDLAATPAGGVLVLDRDNGRYWRLNRHFQLTTTIPGEDEPPETIFQPKDQQPDAQPRRVCPAVPHVGYVLVGDGTHDPPAAPISIESGPNDSVLVLSGPDAGAAAVYE